MNIIKIKWQKKSKVTILIWIIYNIIYFALILKIIFHLFFYNTLIIQNNYDKLPYLVSI